MSLAQQVTEIVQSKVPATLVQVHVGGTGFLEVSVYRVPPTEVRAVKDLILELDTQLCVGTEKAVTPLVRDIETTNRYYPQFAQ